MMQTAIAPKKGVLQERDHAAGDGAPNLQAVDRADVFALSERRASHSNSMLLARDSQNGLDRQAIGRKGRDDGYLVTLPMSDGQTETYQATHYRTVADWNLGT